jgi:hypothetical protein
VSQPPAQVSVGLMGTYQLATGPIFYSCSSILSFSRSILGVGPVGLTRGTTSGLTTVPTFLGNLYSQGTIVSIQYLIIWLWFPLSSPDLRGSRCLLCPRVWFGKMFQFYPFYVSLLMPTCRILPTPMVNSLWAVLTGPNMRVLFHMSRNLLLLPTGKTP